MASSDEAVDVPNPEYTAMAGPWELIDDLLGGTPAMKAAGEKWLPKEEKEQPDIYQVRLQRSVLFERFSAAVDSLSGRPYAQRVKLLGGELPESLRFIDQGPIDDQGRDLTSFCHHATKIALERGLVHLLVDYPQVESRPNVGEERALELRPIFLVLDPKALIGWRSDKQLNGRRKLTQLRILETGMVAAGLYGTKQTRRVRVINETYWELWEWQAKTGQQSGGWVRIEDGTWSIGRITLVTVYFKQTGYMMGKSPLEPLAWLNLAHWQSMSDQRNCLRFARVGIKFVKGLDQAGMDEPILAGVNQAFKTTSANADMKIVEHSGAAIGAGESELRHLEEQMDVVAKGPLIVRASGDATATAKAIDEGKGQCELQSWVHRLEGGMTQSIRLAGEWRGETVPEDLQVDIHDDFGMLLRSDTDLEHIERARDRGDLDRRTYLEGFKLRGLLTETADIDQIVQAVEAEGPDLGMMGRETEEGATQGETGRKE
jgi:hypothetical protein